VQDSFESVEGDLFETYEDCSRESYSSQVNRVRWISRAATTAVAGRDIVVKYGNGLKNKDT